jgi:hypothetical protein
MRELQKSQAKVWKVVEITEVVTFKSKAVLWCYIVATTLHSCRLYEITTRPVHVV